MENAEFSDVDEEELGFSRNYFLAKELGSSAKKSTRKLSDIDVVPEEELREAMSKLEPKHEKEIKVLMDSYISLYPRWLFELRCGFGLLMYGFGSKKALIEEFASKALSDYAVIVINGYLQSINIKHLWSNSNILTSQVLIAMAEILWEEIKASRKSVGSSGQAKQPFGTKSIDDLLAFLNGSHVEMNDSFICLLVHNIDGPALRDSDTQQILSQVAASSHILWDKKMVHTQFNWCWHHVPTFAPYKTEGMFFPLILAHNGTAQSAKTAAIVLQSLTPNAQRMPVCDLYATCRERFLVSSQVTLNSHLTEFKDHELVKTRRNADGQDCLHIPLSSEAIEKLLHEMNQ
ncbi:hypothetical protein V2J09_005078 [Rumex salicifolius]